MVRGTHPTLAEAIGDAGNIYLEAQQILIKITIILIILLAQLLMLETPEIFG